MHNHAKGIRDLKAPRYNNFHRQWSKIYQQEIWNQLRSSGDKDAQVCYGEDCTGCQLCEQACPVLVHDQFQYNLVGRKAAYIPFSIASPRVAAIDIENCTLCGACEKVCPTKCIDFTQEEEEYCIDVKTVIIATGFNLLILWKYHAMATELIKILLHQCKWRDNWPLHGHLIQFSGPETEKFQTELLMFFVQDQGIWRLVIRSAHRSVACIQ